MLRRTVLAMSLGLAALGSVGWANAANDPYVVLVHGAFADGSDWAKVITLLQAKGVQVRAVQNGLNYLGVCAGAFFAGNSPTNGLNLTSGVRFGFYAAEDRGIRKTAVAIARPGAPPLDQ